MKKDYFFRRHAHVVATLLLTLVLAACGGGGGSSAVSSTTSIVEPESTSDSSIVEPDTSEPEPEPAPSSIIVGAARTAASPILNANDIPSGVTESAAGAVLISSQLAVDRGLYGKGVRVALIGRGLFASHVDFDDHLLSIVQFSLDPNDEEQDVDGIHIAGIIGANRNTFGIQGIAPEAEILPLQISSLEPTIVSGQRHFIDFSIAFDYAVSLSSQIIHAGLVLSESVTGTYGGARSRQTFPVFRSFIDSEAIDNTLPTQINKIADVLLSLNNANKEGPAVVFAAGDNGWHEEGIVTQIVNGVTLTVLLSQLDFINSYTDNVYGGLSSLTINANSAGGWGLAPLYRPVLEDFWVNVIAVNARNEIADFSNACGETKAWCIAAPGVNITSTHGGGGYQSRSGTSQAAAHVSGALAVLKSRFPGMPMSAVIDIMFATTEDLGVSGVDDVYGNGLLNLGAAILHEGDVVIIHNPDLFYLPTLSLPTPFTTTVEYTRQRGLALINAATAFSHGYYGEGVTVAIVDSGVLTTHVDLTANLLPGVRIASQFATPEFTDITDLNGHGTHVAGIIGAQLGNGDDGIIGVAPSVRIFPIQTGTDSSTSFPGAYGGLRYAITNTAVTAHVINNSWNNNLPLSGTLTIIDTSTGDRTALSVRIVSTPGFRNVINLGVTGLRFRFAQIERDFTVNGKKRDAVVVFAAGNDGWNQEGGVRYVASTGPSTITADVTDFIDNYVDARLGNLKAFGISVNESSSWALAPHYEPNLLGHWVNVVALNAAGNGIARFSNGCGDTMAWCIAAPGVGIRSTYLDRNNPSDNNEYRVASGTSSAAPHVSGALAVLRSRFGSAMPMSIVLTILFETADDSVLNDPKIYGHGLLDLGAAATIQGLVNLATGDLNPAGSASGAPAAGALLASSFSQLSPALSGLRAKLAGVSVAVRYLGTRHYNTSLDKLLTAVVAPEELPVLGNAAEQMLDTPPPNQLMDNLYVNQHAQSGQLLGLNYNSEHLRLNYTICQDNDECAKPVWSHFGTSAAMDDIAPYYATDKQQAMVSVPVSLPAAFGDSIEVFAGGGLGEKAKEFTYSQLGLRYHALPGWYAEYSRITENDTVLGGEFNGGLGLEGAQSHQFRLAGRYDIGNNWQLFGLYALGIGEAEGGNNSLFKSFNYRYKAWRVGLTKHALFRSDDELRLGYRHYGALDSARASISRGVLNNGVLSRQTDTLNWSESGIQSFLLGYAIRRSDNISIGLGFEHARGDRLGSDNAISLIWKKRF